MGLLHALIGAWPILSIMAFLVWARVTASRLQSEPPRGPVTLILIWVLFLNLGPVRMPDVWYLLCLPLMLQILWHLKAAARQQRAQLSPEMRSADQNEPASEAGSGLEK